MNIAGISRVLMVALTHGLTTTVIADAQAAAQGMDARDAGAQDSNASVNETVENTHIIRIPAQSLGNALLALGSQTGIEIIFFNDIVANLGVDEMEGRYSARQALELMLKDTGLDFHEMAGGGIAINHAHLIAPHAAQTRDELAPESDDHTVQSGPPHHGGGHSEWSSISHNERWIEEVIVTGGLHDVASMDSSRTIATVTSPLIKEMGALNVTDIYTVVPGFNVRAMQDGEYRYNIRGITSQTGTDGFAPISPAATVYLNGAPVTSTLGPQTQTAGLLFDIDRVEILKGPQGTLLGESSLAGTVRYTYKQPDPGSFTAAANASVANVSSTDDMAEHVDAMVNLPLAENAALRLAGWQVREAGFIDNLKPWEPDFNDGRMKGGRFALKHGTDRLAVIGSIYYSKQETLGGSATVGSSYMSLAERLAGKRPFSEDKTIIYSLDVEMNLRWATLQSMTSFTNRSFGANTETTKEARTLIDFTWGGTLRVGEPLRCQLFASCPTFPGIFNFVDPDNPITIGDGWNLQNFNEVADHSSKRWVQELHLVSHSNKPLRWTLGLFWKDGEDTNSDTADVLYFHGRKDTFGALFDAIKALPHNIHTDTVKEYATFGEAHYNITERWEATVGLRYSNIKQGFTVANRQTRDEPLTGKFALSWRPNNDLLTYFSMTTGHRPGNVNGHMEFAVDLYEQQIAQAKVLGNANAVKLLTDLRSQAQPHRFFGADKVTNYEVGTKAISFGDKVRLIAAAYFVEWKNMVVLEQNSFLRDHVEPISTFNINSGGAEIYGIELELNALITDRLRMRFTADTNDSKITKGPLLGDRIIRALNPTPQWAASLIVDYTQLLGSGGILHYHASHARVGKQGDMRPYHKTNVRIMLHGPGSRWHLALFANNLTNEKLISDVQAQTFWWYNPRQVGLELGYGNQRRAKMH